MNPESAMAVLDNAFGWALRASLAAGLLIVIAAAVLWLASRHLGLRWRIAFGVVILARLLLPFSPESRLSVFNLWDPPRQPAAVEIAIEPSPAAAMPALRMQSQPRISPFRQAPPFEIPPPEMLPATAAESRKSLASASSASRPPLATLVSALPILWAGGAVLLIAWAVIRNLRLANSLRRHGLRVDDPRLRKLLDDCRRALGIHRKIPLVATPRLRCAAVFGWRHPRLLIAEDFADRFGDSEIRGIFLHELAHVRRHDVMWNWLAHLAVAIHWFNPLAWLAARRFRADREQMCDAMVLDRLPSGERADYGRTLISLVQNLSNLSAAPAGPSGTPALAPFLTRKSEIKHRLAMMNRTNPPAHWALHAIAALLLAAAGIFTFTSATATADDEKGERERERREATRDRERDLERAREHDRERDLEPGRERGEVPPEVREFNARAEQLRHTVRELAGAGKHDEAEAVERELKAFFAEHPEKAEHFRRHQRHRENEAIEHKFHELEQALQKAREEDNEEKVRHLEAQLEKMHHAVRDRDEGDDAERRIRHLHQAAENLEAAGLHDQAHGLRRQAEEIERELQHRETKDVVRHAEHLEREVQELRHVVAELREHVAKLENELRQQRGEDEEPEGRERRGDRERD